MDALFLDLQGSLAPSALSSTSSSSSSDVSDRPEASLNDSGIAPAQSSEAFSSAQAAEKDASGDVDRWSSWDEEGQSDAGSDPFWFGGRGEAVGNPEPEPARASSSKRRWGVGMTMHLDTFGGMGVVGDQAPSTRSSTVSSVDTLTHSGDFLSEQNERHGAAADKDGTVQADLGSSLDVESGSARAVSGMSDTSVQRRRQRSESRSSDRDANEDLFGLEADQSGADAQPSSDMADFSDNPNMKVVAVIGRDVDQPGLVIDQLMHGVNRKSEEWCDVALRPIVIPHSALTHTDCSDYISSRRVDVMVLCYNTTQTRIMLTSTRGGYYRHLLPYAKRVIGESNILFVLTHCKTKDSDLVDSSLELRLRGQPLMESFFDQQRVLSWDEAASDFQQKRFLEVVNASRRPPNECLIL